MKTVTFQTDLLVALAQLDDKDTGQITKGIAAYVSEGKEPTFSNTALKAFFTIFRNQIDVQRKAHEERSVINKRNAASCSTKRKVVAKRKEVKQMATNAESVFTSEEIVAIEGKAEHDADGATDLQQVAAVNDVAPILTNVPIPLEQIEAVYPKLGSYREESLQTWKMLSEEQKRDAIRYVTSYVEMHPHPTDQLYLNRYLKERVWEARA